MALTISQIDRVYRTWRIRATLRDGSIADLNGVTLALLTPRTTPTSATTWETITYEEYAEPDADGYTGEATALLAGPGADPSAPAFVVPTTGADAWLRIADSPEVDATLVERISVQ